MWEDDAQSLTKALGEALGPLPAPTARRGTAPPPVCVIRSVLEPCRLYDEGAVRRFQSSCPEVRTCEDLQALIARHGGPRAFLLRVLGLRDAPRARALVEALNYVIQVQRQFRGRTEAHRLRTWARSMRPGDYHFVGIAGFGIEEFQRLRAHLGANAAIPDRRVTRYIARQLHRTVTNVQGLYLLERAAAIGEFDVRDIHVRLHEARLT